MSGASVRAKDMCTNVEVPISMAINSVHAQNNMHSVVDLHIAAIMQILLYVPGARFTSKTDKSMQNRFRSSALNNLRSGRQLEPESD